MPRIHVIIRRSMWQIIWNTYAAHFSRVPSSLMLSPVAVSCRNRLLSFCWIECVALPSLCFAWRRKEEHKKSENESFKIKFEKRKKNVQKHPHLPHFAVGEKGKEPLIIIFEWPSLSLVALLRHGTRKSYSHLDYK